MGVYQTTWELLVLAGLLVGALADLLGAPAALALAGSVSAVAVTALLIADSRVSRIGPRTG
jgi:hypothetical protein